MTDTRLDEIDRRYGSGGGYTGAPTKQDLRRVIIELVDEVRRQRRAERDAQLTTDGAERAVSELECESGAPTAPGVSEGVSGAVRADAIPFALWIAFDAASDACWAAHGHPEGLADYGDCCHKAGLAAVLTQLGLREEWGVHLPADGGDEPRRWHGGEKTARRNLPLMRSLDPGAALWRRYVTGWEDVDAG